MKVEIVMQIFLYKFAFFLDFRSAVLLRMGAYGHKPTVEEAKKRFNDHISGTAIIPADLRSAVYRTVAGNGGKICSFFMHVTL